MPRNYFTICLSWLTLVLSFSAIAQTGPGGVGSSTTNRVWIMADQDVFTDLGTTAASNGNAVQQISDQSGNGNNLLQNTVANRPTLQTSIGGLNNQSVLRFDGNDDFMSDALGGSFTEVSMFVVGNFAQVNQANFDYLVNLGTSYTDGVSISRNTSNRYYSYTESSILLGPTLNNSYHMYHQEHTASNPFHTLRIDGSSQGVVAAGSQVSIGNNFRIGAMIFSSVINTLEGDIAEALVFNTTLNTTQRILVENYLDAKYGLGSSSDKYAFEATHGNEVAGIGRESAGDNHLEAQGPSIVRIRNPSLMDDGDYLVWGHDGGALTTETGDVPGSYTGAGGRLTRVWRADENATDVGTVTVIFNMNGISIGTDPNNYELLTDTDGTFTNATSLGTSPTISGDSVIFSNVNLPDNTYFTIGNTGDVVTCTSFSSDLWPDVTWDCMTVPDSTHNVNIQNGTLVIVTDSRSASDITIDGTLSITGSGSLVVDGDLTVSATGNLILSAGSSLIFRGSSAQTVTNNSGSAIELSNVVINNPVSVTLAAGDEIHISEGLSLTAGELTCTQQLRMLSVSGTQSAIVSVGTGTITGSIQMDRFIDTRNSSWGTFSAPVTDAVIEDIDDDIFISGITGGDGTAAGFVSVWFYNATTDAYESVSNTADNMESGRGYELWLADNNTNWNAGTIDYPGTPSVAEVSLTLNTGGGGWNLVGNPYPAFLDWSSVSTGVTGITGDQYWIYDQATSQYVARGDGTTIPPGQGFWVNSSVSSLTLTPSNDFANSSTSEFFKSSYVSALEEVELHMQSDREHYAHSAFIRKEYSAYSGLDDFDMPMLRSPDTNSCEVAIETGSEDLLVNYMSPEVEEVVIPIKLTAGVAGPYTFSIDGLDNMHEYQCINIVDRSTNERMAVSSGSSLKINLEKDEPRHLDLVMTAYDNDDCLAPASVSSSIDPLMVFAREDEIIVDYRLDDPSMAQVNVYDLMGNLIFSEEQAAHFNREFIPMSDQASGMYLINVQFENGTVFAQKVFIP